MCATFVLKSNTTVCKKNCFFSTWFRLQQESTSAHHNQGISGGQTGQSPWVSTLLHMGGNNEDKSIVTQILMFVTGINTLQQSFFGAYFPAVIGGTYTFVLPTLLIILAGRYPGEPDSHTECDNTGTSFKQTTCELCVHPSIQIVLFDYNPFDAEEQSVHKRSIYMVEGNCKICCQGNAMETLQRWPPHPSRNNP
ncbi:nucleobase-ascorbate transporter 1-like isoform X7 [Lolium rigidum]|uniref:nucleobase-ascorbate transporter 1-like isoform X7 n=1 Tax=Lolium rigidum TaxID=89674 RepID=UPI001F5C222D|nr:nucleobase-ascorbate transporter 1-like isoform X7 [Lolium rigidum]